MCYYKLFKKILFQDISKENNIIILLMMNMIIYMLIFFIYNLSTDNILYILNTSTGELCKNDNNNIFIITIKHKHLQYIQLLI